MFIETCIFEKKLCVCLATQKKDKDRFGCIHFSAHEKMDLQKCWSWPNWLQSLQWFQWILLNNRPFTQTEKTAEGQDQVVKQLWMSRLSVTTTHVNDRRALQYLPWDFLSLMRALTFTIKWFWPKFMWLPITFSVKGDSMSQFQNLAEDVDLQTDAPNKAFNHSCGGLLCTDPTPIMASWIGSCIHENGHFFFPPF